mmetsp:Transcript_93634/g.251191  ORF Transcript_93634/g.251191 Transcript_93634/m.251191 type:complete len:97 (-) Transcript_93634:244-534(-)
MPASGPFSTLQDARGRVGERGRERGEERPSQRGEEEHEGHAANARQSSTRAELAVHDERPTSIMGTGAGPKSAESATAVEDSEAEEARGGRRKEED